MMHSKEEMSGKRKREDALESLPEDFLEEEYYEPDEFSFHEDGEEDMLHIHARYYLFHMHCISSSCANTCVYTYKHPYVCDIPYT